MKGLIIAMFHMSQFTYSFSIVDAYHNRERLVQVNLWHCTC